MIFKKFVGNGKEINKDARKRLSRNVSMPLQMFDVFMRRTWNLDGMIIECQEKRIVTSKSYTNYQNQMIYIYYEELTT